MNGMEKNKLKYKLLQGFPKRDNLTILVGLYNVIFEDALENFFIERLQQKENVFSIIAFQKDIPIGFKIGYRYNNTTFYSWVGGVLSSYRKQGVAQELTNLQHEFAKKNGYLKIRTKSMNKYKPMIMLNLKKGFEIISVYTNKKQQTKIIFEKNL